MDHRWPTSRRNSTSRNTTWWDYVLPFNEYKTTSRWIWINWYSLWVIRESLITTSFEGNLEWVAIDLYNFARAIWWMNTKNNTNLISSRLQNDLWLETGSDFQLVNDTYQISTRSWVNKVIAYMTALLNGKHGSIMTRVQQESNRVLH